jgi:cell division septation protein DedD
LVARTEFLIPRRDTQKRDIIELRPHDPTPPDTGQREERIERVSSGSSRDLRLSLVPLRYRAIPLLLVAAACTGVQERPGAVASMENGPDAIVVRVARNGGIVRAYLYPRLDSLIWKSTDLAPPLANILAFDQENGTLAYVDRKGQPGWIDLRLGTVAAATKTPLANISSSDAWAIYGVRRDSMVQRLTPSGDWALQLKGKVSELYPLRDGSLVMQVERGGTTRLFRVHPPESALTDSAIIQEPRRGWTSPLGERLFFGISRDLVTIRVQALSRPTRLRLRGEIVSVSPTPSGDRLYVATRGSRVVDVVDRFNNIRLASIRLPGPVRELRMDALGRLLLARPQQDDSVWVIAIGTNRLIDSQPTVWRSDLPFVAPDGSLATVGASDVAFVVPGDKRPRIVVREGANELWQFVHWNGFRPRAKGLDQPVVFQEESTGYHPPVVPSADSAKPSRLPRIDTPTAKPQTPVADTSARAVPAREGWTVSFAAVLSEDRARDLARGIRVEGQQARVVVTITEGVRVHRVVLGPYSTRVDADRVGRASGRSYWVFEGPP